MQRTAESEVTVEEMYTVACPSCDLVHDLSGLADGDTATCTRCGHFLTRYKVDLQERLQVFSLSALIFLALACSYPFMQFSRSGLASEMTLPQTAIALWNNGMPVLAFMVAGFIILIPAAVLVCTLVMATSLKNNRRAAWLSGLGHLLFTLQAWSMVEVFLVGVLVSLVKIAKMATIVLGISFWAYAAFAIMFTVTLTNLDRFQCWRHIEALSVR